MAVTVGWFSLAVPIQLGEIREVWAFVKLWPRYYQPTRIFYQERSMHFPWRVMVVVAFLGCVSAFNIGAADPKAKPKLKVSKVEQKLIDLTNEARKKEKLPPLKPNATLFAAARAHSKNMAKKGKMEHKLDGKQVKERLQDAGYPFSWYGENIAMSTHPKIEKVMEGWMNSEGHRANILKDKYTEIGIGIADDGKGRVYYTQVFGRPRKSR
jgi:uncharacterized protein YkwD